MRHQTLQIFGIFILALIVSSCSSEREKLVSECEASVGSYCLSGRENYRITRELTPEYSLFNITASNDELIASVIIGQIEHDPTLGPLFCATDKLEPEEAAKKLGFETGNAVFLAEEFCIGEFLLVLPHEYDLALIAR